MTADTILMIEDEKAIADTIQYALESDGFNVKWVSNGKQAREKLIQSTINLCILDVGLANCNGFKLLKEIRQQERFQDLPVLILTARSEEIDRVMG